MEPLASPTAPVSPPAALATPGEAEARRALLERQMENYLTPLSQYCNDLPTLDQLGPDEFRFAYQVREALDALLRLDEATDELLTTYRGALTTAQQQAAARVPSLEEALGLPKPEPSDHATDPLYRLGWVRGARQTQRQYERVVSLYAEHAILVPPPSYTPSPLVVRVQNLLSSPAMQAYAALPLATRQALNALTPADLHAHVTASSNGAE